MEYFIPIILNEKSIINLDVCFNYTKLCIELLYVIEDLRKIRKLYL